MKENISKINIMIVDDQLEEANKIKAILLPTEEGRDEEMLYNEEKTELVDKLLNVKIIHSVPDALDYLKNGIMPDIAVIDINFKGAGKHVGNEYERDEGLYLFEILKKNGGVYVFCISNFLDQNKERVNALGIGEWGIQKSEPEKITQRVGEVLKMVARRALASMPADDQKKLKSQLEQAMHFSEVGPEATYVAPAPVAQNWKYMKARTLRKKYALKHLMAGWAMLYYDLTTQTPDIKFPSSLEICPVIKNLLPYAEPEPE